MGNNFIVKFDSKSGHNLVTLKNILINDNELDSLSAIKTDIESRIFGKTKKLDNESMHEYNTRIDLMLRDELYKVLSKDLSDRLFEEDSFKNIALGVLKHEIGKLYPEKAPGFSYHYSSVSFAPYACFTILTETPEARNEREITLEWVGITSHNFGNFGTTLAQKIRLVGSGGDTYKRPTRNIN